MGTCPFCKGEIPADLLEVGGRCPRCLIEIPGEDAPTDPGAEAKAAQEAADALAKKPRWGVILGIASLAFAATSGLWVAFAPQEPDELGEIYTGAENYKRVSSQFLSIDLDSEEDEAAPVEATTNAVAKNPNKKQNTQPSTPSKEKSNPGLVGSIPDLPEDDGPDIAAVELSTAEGSPEAGSNRPSSARGTSGDTARAGMGVPNLTGSGVSGSMDMGVGGGPRDRGAKAQEYCGDQIRDVAKALMSQLGKQLKTCADRALKVDDSFQATVKVQIAIEKDGRIAAIDLAPSNPNDTEFLDCLERTISKSKFPRFCEPLDLSKTYSFGSGGGF